MWIYYQPNPVRSTPTGDCTVRAIAKALDVTWDDAHDMTCYMSKMMGDIQNANAVVGGVLRSNGFIRQVIPNRCPDCYTVRDFCYDNPYGLYVLGTGTHFVTVEDGNYYDSWDSGDEIVTFFWEAR